jgi:hypothetical protein
MRARKAASQQLVQVLPLALGRVRLGRLRAWGGAVIPGAQARRAKAGKSMAWAGGLPPIGIVTNRWAVNSAVFGQRWR